MAVLANALGNYIVNATVSASTFTGPPLLAYGATITSTASPRWVAASAFADLFSAPLLGASSSADLLTVSAYLACLRRFFTTSLVSPAPVYSPALAQDAYIHTGLYQTGIYYPTFCGPILVLPDVGAATVDGQAAWDWGRAAVRTTSNHSYGIGQMAIGDDVLYPSAPIYSLDPATYASQLTALRRLWKSPPSPTTSQWSTLLALEGSRPGISRSIHPSLIGWVLTARPA